MSFSNRFRFLTLMAAVGLCALMSASVPGCGSGTNSAKGDKLTVGFIYVGPKDDYGYNQAHAAGAQAVKEIPGVEVKEEERADETADVQKSMKSIIELDGD